MPRRPLADKLSPVEPLPISEAKAPRQPPGGTCKDRAPGEEAAEGEGRWLCCAACGARVTTDGARATVHASHEHVRTNPHALTFRIGCFSDAPGCLPAGPCSTFWTWFPGYSWQAAVCGGCVEHLGWRFRAEGPEELPPAFFGLILDKLVEEEDG